MRDGRVYDIGNLIDKVHKYEGRASHGISSPNFGESQITRNDTENLSYDDFR